MDLKTPPLFSMGHGILKQQCTDILGFQVAGPLQRNFHCAPCPMKTQIFPNTLPGNLFSTPNCVVKENDNDNVKPGHVRQLSQMGGTTTPHCRRHRIQLASPIYMPAPVSSLPSPDFAYSASPLRFRQLAFLCTFYPTFAAFMVRNAYSQFPGPSTTQRRSRNTHAAS